MNKPDFSASVAPRNSLSNIATANSRQMPTPMQVSLLPGGGYCMFCESTTKNLKYLENYLRTSAASNSCSSCATCLSFLIFMKQQSGPPSKKPPASFTTDCYNMHQTITHQPFSNPHKANPKKPSLNLKRILPKGMPVITSSSAKTFLNKSPGLPKKTISKISKVSSISQKKTLKRKSIAPISGKVDSANLGTIKESSLEVNMEGRKSTTKKIKQKRKAGTIESTDKGNILSRKKRSK